MVGNERDLVRVRTNYRKETVYLYRLNSAGRKCAETAARLPARINELADRPEFYHLLTNSCTINIIRYANAAGRTGQFNIRHLLNGSDRQLPLSFRSGGYGAAVRRAAATFPHQSDRAGRRITRLISRIAFALRCRALVEA